MFPGENVRGLTTLELISVMVILGILVAVAVPMFNTSSIDVSNAASTVESDLRFVQELAMSRNPQNPGDIGITFSVGSSSYVIDDPQDMFDQTRVLPEGATITQGGTISFNKYGEPEIAGPTATIQITSGGDAKTISVEQFTGRVTGP